MTKVTPASLAEAMTSTRSRAEVGSNRREIYIVRKAKEKATTAARGRTKRNRT
jgi:hypothetical protein